MNPAKGSLTRLVVIVCVLIGIAGCGKGSSADSSSTKNSGHQLLAEQKSSRDGVCACKNMACVNTLQAAEKKRLAAMSPEQARAATKAAVKAAMGLSKADQATLAKLTKETAACIDKLSGAHQGCRSELRDQAAAVMRPRRQLPWPTKLSRGHLVRATLSIALRSSADARASSERCGSRSSP